jgi:hypothetical protein
MSLRLPTKAETAHAAASACQGPARPGGCPRLEGKPGAGAAQARLHLVEDEQHLVRVADAAPPREKARRRHNDPGLSLDRLDQHRCRLGCDRTLDRGEIAERYGAEARGGRAEAVAVIRFRGEGDDGRGAAVEIAGRDDDLGASRAMPLTR